MEEIRIVFMKEDDVNPITEWFGYCPPRVGDYAMVQSYKLVTKVIWVNPHCVHVHVGDMLQGGDK